MLIIDHVTKFYPTSPPSNPFYCAGRIRQCSRRSQWRGQVHFQDIMNILRYGSCQMEVSPRQPEGRQYRLCPELPALYPLLTVANILNSVLASMA